MQPNITIRVCNPLDLFLEVKDHEDKTLQEIHREGMDALNKALGSVDMIRFLQMFDEGTGDNTKEHTMWLKKDLHEIPVRSKS